MESKNWILKKIDDAWVAQYMTTAEARPRGEYLIVKGVETQFPKVETDEDGNISVIEDEAKKTEYETDYQRLRKLEYPDMADFLDAMVKINSGDEDLIVEGNAQLTAYYAACLAVKTKYPKPE